MKQKKVVRLSLLSQNEQEWSSMSVNLMIPFCQSKKTFIFYVLVLSFSFSWENGKIWQRRCRKITSVFASTSYIYYNIFRSNLKCFTLSLCFCISQFGLREAVAFFTVTLTRSLLLRSVKHREKQFQVAFVYTVCIVYLPRGLSMHLVFRLPYVLFINTRATWDRVTNSKLISVTNPNTKLFVFQISISN